jgi:hypothetical protein
MRREDAYQLYAAMLQGRVSELEVGGLMPAMRVKGETVADPNRANRIDWSHQHQRQRQTCVIGNRLASHCTHSVSIARVKHGQRIFKSFPLR